MDMTPVFTFLSSQENTNTEILIIIIIIIIIMLEIQIDFQGWSYSDCECCDFFRKLTNRNIHLLKIITSTFSLQHPIKLKIFNNIPLGWVRGLL